MALQKSVTLLSGASFPAAYEWIAWLAIDYAGGTARLLLNVHPDATTANAGLGPIVQIAYATGQAEPDPAHPGATIAFPTLAQIYADNKAAWDSIHNYLYTKIAAMPSQAGATQV